MHKRLLLSLLLPLLPIKVGALELRSGSSITQTILKSKLRTDTPLIQYQFIITSAEGVIEKLPPLRAEEMKLVFAEIRKQFRSKQLTASDLDRVYSFYRKLISPSNRDRTLNNLTANDAKGAQTLIASINSIQRASR